MNEFRDLDAFSGRHTNLSVKVSESTGADNRITIALSGSLDNESGHAFMKEMEIAIAGGAGLSGIRIECSGLKYMSSTGAGAFATIAIAASKKNMDVTLVNPPDNVMTVLSLLGFDKFIAIEKAS